VRVADLWDPLESDTNVTGAPPAAVLLEALDLVGAGRSALARLRAVPALREVPVLLAVTVNALERLSVDIHGRRVRMKLGTLDPIETVRGVGYKVCS
jgi:hypothetical protein